MEDRKLIIKPQKAFSFRISELLEYRELIYFFARRDIKIRYRNTFLGIIWAVAQPVFMALVFTLIVQSGMNISTDNMPAFLYFLSGLLLWNFFSQSISFSALSMLANANIIRKVYFPRLAIPVAAIITALLDLLINIIFFFIIAAVYKFTTQAEISLTSTFAALLTSLPVVILFTVSAGIFLSALNVKYRDVRNAIPFFIQIMFFLTPVIYSTRFGDNILVKKILELNPLNFAIEMFRSNLTSADLEMVQLPVLTLSLLVVFYFIAIYTFRKMEDHFADLI